MLVHLNQQGREARVYNAVRQLWPWLLLCGVIWLNAYIARDLFTAEATAKTNSMQGFWAAMARWADSAWWKPTWWPYWDAGMPFEYTYAPLFPGMAAGVAHLGGVSAIRAVQMLCGLVYSLGPALAGVALWRLTRSAVWAFGVAAAYSLLSPALLLAPNESFGF